MQLDKCSNEKLVEMLQIKFDNRTFEEVFNRFRPLYRKCSKRILIAGFDLDDYHQEARLALMTVIEHYKSNQNYYVASFFARIYENRLLNVQRKTLAKKRINQNQIVSFNEPLVMQMGTEADFTYEDIVCEPSPEIPELIIAKDTLEEFISALSPLEKQVLSCKMNAEENDVLNIATLLSMDKKAVENALARCRRKCRDYFSKSL